MNAKRLAEIEAHAARNKASEPMQWELVIEVRRLRLALTVIGNLPDAEGATHGVALDDRRAAYARAVIYGADPLPVEVALGEGK